MLPDPASAESAAAADLRGRLAIVCLVLLSEAPVGVLLKTAPEALVGPLARMSYIAAYAAGAALILTGPRLRLGAAGVLLLALAAWMGLSLAWSQSPAATAEKLVLQGGTLVAAAGLAGLPMARLIRIAAGVIAALAALSLALALAAPDLGRMQEIHPGAWSGLWQEKNRFAAVMGLGVMFCIAAAFRGSRAWLLGAALCALLLVPADSATALVCLGAAAAAAGFIWLVRRGPRLATAAGVVAVLGAALLAAAAARPDLVAQLTGRDPSFTGRQEIWAGVSRLIAERPWTGYGYGAFWEVRPGPADWLIEDLDFTARTAHQSWLELQLETGRLGAWLLGAVMICAVAAAARRLLAGRSVYLAGPLFVYVLVMSLSESVLAAPNGLVWLLTAAVALKLEQGPDDDP